MGPFSSIFIWISHIITSVCGICLLICTSISLNEHLEKTFFDTQTSISFVKDESNIYRMMVGWGKFSNHSTQTLFEPLLWSWEMSIQLFSLIPIDTVIWLSSSTFIIQKYDWRFQSKSSRKIWCASIAHFIYDLRSKLTLLPAWYRNKNVNIHFPIYIHFLMKINFRYYV